MQQLFHEIVFNQFKQRALFPSFLHIVGEPILMLQWLYRQWKICTHFTFYMSGKENINLSKKHNIMCTLRWKLMFFLLFIIPSRWNQQFSIRILLYSFSRFLYESTKFTWLSRVKYGWIYLNFIKFWKTFGKLEVKFITFNSRF